MLVLCVAVAVAAMAVRRLVGPDVAPSPPAEGEYRIATYNLGWLLDETSEERYRNIVRVIESLQPHVLAVQEVESKEALLRVLPSGYKVAIADDPMEDQELGLAVREPFKVIGKHTILFAHRRFDHAFPGRRNALEVEIEAPDGRRLFVYVVHYKSRSGGRTESDSARIESSRLLLDHFEEKNRTDVIVLGDFNDTPNDESVNILESGDPLGGEDRSDVGKYLVNLTQPFYEKDYVTQGFFRKYRGSETLPIVRGASEDNERLRGTYYEFPLGVKVTEALFDQILVTPSLYSLVTDSGVYSGENALEGKDGYITRNREGVAFVQRHGTLPSDHLPVYADFKFSAR